MVGRGTLRTREHELIMGVRNGGPSGNPGGTAPSESQGQSTLKLKAFEHLGVNRRSQICQLLCILQIQ